MIQIRKISILIFTLVAIMAFVSSCKEDEATISSNIVGSWKVDSTATVYNGGVLAQYVVGLNSDSIGDIIKPTFNDCSFTFNSDNSGAFAFPYMGLQFTDSYEVNAGKVIMTIPSLASKQITLNVTSITTSQMSTTLSLTDFTTIVNSIDTTATSNVDLMALATTLIPTLNDINTKLSEVELSAVGLNLTPTVTLIFNKQ